MKHLLALACGMALLFAHSTLANEQGKKIYEQACRTCHDPSVATALNSPIVFDKKAWDERFEKAKIAAKADDRYKDAMAYLIAQVRNGKGAMVAGGMCLNENTPDKKCTDDDYKAAIEYMRKPQ